MIIEDLSITHREILEEKLYLIDIDLSEYSFPNLYLFRKAHQYKIIKGEFDYYITGKTYDNITYIMPTSDISKSDENITKELKGLLKTLSIEMIFPVPEEWLNLFSANEFSITYNDNDTDYIFNIEKFRTYSGRKLHSKKNLVNQFLNNYQCETEKFNNDNIKYAKEILEIWQNESNESKDETDYFPCLEAIENFSNLKLCGAIFFANKSPCGFLIGEELNYRTYGIHFAKGISTYKGVYQYMFLKCSEINTEKFKYFNLEQDMGKPSLRASKKSYYPDKYGIKYRLKYL